MSCYEVNDPDVRNGMDDIHPNPKHDPEEFFKVSLWDKGFAFLFGIFIRDKCFMTNSKFLYDLYTPNRYRFISDPPWARGGSLFHSIAEVFIIEEKK